MLALLLGIGPIRLRFLTIAAAFAFGAETLRAYFGQRQQPL